MDGIEIEPSEQPHEYTGPTIEEIGEASADDRIRSHWEATLGLLDRHEEHTGPTIEELDDDDEYSGPTLEDLDTLDGLDNFDDIEYKKFDKFDNASRTRILETLEKWKEEDSNRASGIEFKEWEEKNNLEWLEKNSEEHKDEELSGNSEKTNPSEWGDYLDHIDNLEREDIHNKYFTHNKKKMIILILLRPEKYLIYWY